MFRIIFFAALFLAAACRPHYGFAEDADRIAAVINDDVITMRELDERVRMSMALSQIKDSVDARKRVVTQTLQKMIDERLIMQDAKRLKVSTPSKEVDEYISQLEKQNNMAEGALARELGKIGVSAAAIREQFTADMTWQRLSHSMFMPSIKITDNEISERLQIIAGRLGKPEYMVADIFLQVDSPSQREQTKNLGDRLLEQLRAGAPFPVLASQFSQAPSASNGGNLGWISEGGVDDELFAVIKEMSPGTASKLIPTTEGFHILALISRRVAGTGVPGSESTIVFSKMVLPVPAKDPPSKAVLFSKVEALVGGIKDCDAFDAKGKKEAAVSVERIGPVNISGLAKPEQMLLMNVSAKETSHPAEDPRGISVYMVCSREDKLAPLPTRDAIRRQLELERIELLANRYLLDLRRFAFIDTRL